MRTKHLCVLIYIRIKGEVGAVKYVEILQYFFTDRPKAVLLLSNLFCYLCVTFVLYYTVSSVP